MLWANILGFIPSLFGKVVEIHKTNKAVKAAIDERKDELKSMELIARIEKIKTASASDMKMDEDANTRIAWADDLTLLLALTPACLAFYPPALPAVTDGFKELSQLPDWYQAVLCLMLVSVWGYRRVVMPIVQGIAKTYLGVRTK